MNFDIDPDHDRVKVKQRAKHLVQRLFISKLDAWMHTDQTASPGPLKFSVII